ncbi:TonB-dependent receptor [Chryseobacterium sp. MEBOG06]|uniref:outer membrane beta-barrel family protein n=1 Tax=unclassified Chryseobacterium TaxID=2593645 RepID=UPI001F3599E8|nr:MULTISPECIES: outer membrane beta-barrel family protein [unclassified Chryseobacterium]UKB84538.1 TonB-dependent receptor [Chryseobacterium sp. MEBOG06]
MKKLLIFLCFPAVMFSQTQKIEGIIVNEQNQKLSLVPIDIYNFQNLLLKTIRTNEDGHFILDGIADPSVKLVIKELEYAPYEQKLDIKSQSQILQVVLKREDHDIQEVVLTKKKPLVTRKIDRLEFNVENSNITSLSAWEILQKTPGVTVNNEKLAIKGSQNILVTINDKKVILTGDELKNLLENTQGQDIRSVEVITNPPAKYEASGSAVLNIVMKENKIKGYRSSIFSQYIQSQYGKGKVGISQYYKKDKLSLMGSYYLNGGTYFREGIDQVNYVEDQTRWVSTMNRKDKNRSQSSVNLNVEYEIDSLTNLSLNYSGLFRPKSFGRYDVPTLIYNSQNIVESNYRTINDHHSSSSNNALSAEINRKFNKKSQITWTNYFTGNNTCSYQDVITLLNFANQSPKENNFITNNKSNIELYSSQLDYQWKGEKWNLESGLKYSFVKTGNQLVFSDNENGKLNYRNDKSNIFDYKEHNFALYTSLSYNIGKWNFKGGLRAENTDIQGVVSDPYEVNTNKYWKLFPTLYTQYTTESNHHFGLSYGKRISRPSYSWLNPAKSYYNLFSYFQGDPNLKATIIHNLNFNYTWKNWNLDFYYRKEINPSMEISYQNPTNNNLIYHLTNIEKEQAFGFSLYKNFQIKKWWILNISENLEHNENYFIGVDAVLHKNKIVNLESDISTSFILNKATEWKLEIGNRYNSPHIQGTFRISGSSSTYLIMNKKLFNKKLETSLMFNDIFRTSKKKVSTKYANQDNFYLDYGDTQNFTISLKYNFGNQSVKAAKPIKKTDEQGRM